MRNPFKALGVCAVLGLAAAALLLPGAASAGAAASCPNKVIKLKTETEPPSNISEPVKAIKAEGGVTYAQAYEGSKRIQFAVPGG